jgi:hypothetical protein
LEEGEDVDEFAGMTEEQIEEEQRKRKARAKAETLAMIGDLPFSDIKPPRERSLCLPIESGHHR